MSANSEFHVENAPRYDHRSAPRWILSHAWRYKGLIIASLLLYLVGHTAYSGARLLLGTAAEQLGDPAQRSALLGTSLAIGGALILDGISLLLAAYALEVLSNRVGRDSREELYAALLGKSQTYHNRQRAGDIMARATDDMDQIRGMIMPGISLIIDAALAIVIPLVYIGLISPQMLFVPLLFVVAYVIALRDYLRRLEPTTIRQRTIFGTLNGGLEESISGIEIVKASAQEAWERIKFRRNARAFRDAFVAQGEVEARYTPLLLYGLAFGAIFIHAMWLYTQGQLTIPNIIAIMSLFAVLRFPTFISIFTFSLVQLGLASGRRILTVIQAETELDENRHGHSAPIEGSIRFEHVSFGYDDHTVLRDLTFTVNAGQTVAIVGQTGAGKSTLTQLVNRTYDADDGRILIDGVDVRDWQLDSLRSQIGKIEQDIFLFQRSIRDNIAFGVPGASDAQIEAVARAAQAHDFIMRFPNGYETEVGERGVTLSGGQRQRIALARAFLSDPRILILDDSTSAIDSATEDEIQKALRKAEEGRTTLLITHRLSQIRWADLILVLDDARLVASGSHDELLRRSPHYRRIFARYDIDLPPLERSSVGALARWNDLNGGNAQPRFSVQR
ncbi:MAG: ABC transporter ATP-binding protein [Anaerolineales bacterium]|nr:ABC transporter ATP-binding protein [Anaerolineales bacterium]MCB9126443.1 ABC transporter ATP-binding protein [Ardenticatenales bacterium]MCB9171602.1 ABC transporter ATP-binding protein [Ardenticatenales bacterium]